LEAFHFPVPVIFRSLGGSTFPQQDRFFFVDYIRVSVTYQTNLVARGPFYWGDLSTNDNGPRGILILWCFMACYPTIPSLFSFSLLPPPPLPAVGSLTLLNETRFRRFSSHAGLCPNFPVFAGRFAHKLCLVLTVCHFLWDGPGECSTWDVL